MAYKNHTVKYFLDFCEKFHKYIYKSCTSVSRARYWRHRIPNSSILMVDNFYLVVSDVDLLKCAIDIENTTGRLPARSLLELKEE